MEADPKLAAILARLERQGLKLEAEAVRLVALMYRQLDFRTLLALLTMALDSPNPITRVRNLERLLREFDSAVVGIRPPPPNLVSLMGDAVALGVTTTGELLSAQAPSGGVTGGFERFSLDPATERQFVQHSQARFAKFWGNESARFRQNVEATMLTGLERGQGARQVATELRRQLDLSRTRANLIARNELSNARASGMEQSQRALGITSYRWVTIMDGRERPAHAHRNGETFQWDAPPEGGHPGQDFQCRCTALPLWPGADAVG